MSSESGRDVVFIGDVHLDEGDPQLKDFLSFLDGLPEIAGTVVLMGDLFEVWIGRPELEQSHHRAVADKLGDLRRRGVRVLYLEGNRDYRVGLRYVGTALDEATDQGIEERVGGHRLFAIHGDMVNPRDHQYRRWRRVSRSKLVWGLFNLMPSRLRLRLSDHLVHRFSRTNMEFRMEFPAAEVDAYAAEFFRQGYDTVVLGHFHVEKDLQLTSPDPPGRILVLPEWKGSRRHLVARRDGEIVFVDSRY